MKNLADLSMEHSLFSGEAVGEICVLTFKEMPLLHVTELESKEALFDYLELVSCRDNVKALLIKSAPVKMERNEYIEFYQKKIASGADRLPYERMFNAINQFILKLAGLNKMVIHVDRGNVILLYMNISLACDYRIVADNTVYQNPNIELGVVPTGGSIFFLSKLLGSVITSRMLLSGEDVTAVQAQELGIVDKVVPLEDLDQLALETARSYARLPSDYCLGIKKLLSFNNELSDYLDYENKLFRKLTRPC
ncbi:MAG: enoyl-CoA hydratase/isomerase family protein [Chloroflexi bacterium]|nr:enoyl-CoA hydratase/isomerase family protein [Chloroflexota bacterium]